MAALIYLFTIAAILLILTGIFGLPGSGKRRVVLPKEENRVKGLNIGSFIFTAFPFIRKFLENLKYEEKIKNKIDAAHINLTVQRFILIKLVLMIAAGTAGSVLVNKSDPVVLIISVALGYIIPDFWLKNKIKQRKYAIARVLPETVDLLGLCVEAGLDFTTAVKWIIEKKVSSNPMLEDLTLVLEEIKWGKPRSQALKDMAKRLDVPEVNSFVHALVQAERMGTPVSEAFGIISEDTRLQRYRRGERYALQAPIKILIPLIFCILPVIGIIIGGPVILQFTKGGLFTGFGK